MFSGINEAYNNNSLKKQLKEMDKQNRQALEIAQMQDEIEKNQVKNGIVPPHTGQNMHQIWQPTPMDASGLNPDYVGKTFVDAQGDMTLGMNLQGTALNDLKSEDSTFESDSDYSDNDFESSKLISEESTMSFPSSTESTMDLSQINNFSKKETKSNDKIDYKKIVKKVFEEIIDKQHKSEEDSSDSDTSFVIKQFKNKSKKKNKNNEVLMLTDELKEVIIVIVIGIFIIIIIDFLVRISRAAS